MKKILIGSLLFFLAIYSKHADLIIFSYNRPLQLYALLESTEKYVHGLGSITVVYRTDSAFANAYRQVQNDFEYVCFTKQSNQPRKDFKPLTLKAIRNTQNDYILFAVDDIIIKDYIDIEYCISLLEQTNAYGFYLRLGQNLNFFYMLQKPQPVPPSNHIDNDVFSWQFAKGHYDWGYPHTVDMTIYRKNMIVQTFQSIQFDCPNRLEAIWANTYAKKIMHRYGLYFKDSKVVNVPLNRVQNVFVNNNMNLLSAHQLLNLFEQGKKIDITQFYRVNNNSAHFAFEPHCIHRLSKERC